MRRMTSQLSSMRVPAQQMRSTASQSVPLTAKQLPATSQITQLPHGGPARARGTTEVKRRKLSRLSSAASSSPQTELESSGPADELQPWAFGFQLNERYLDWDAAAHTQLLKIACAEKLDLQVADVEERLQELASLVPDLAQKLGKMKADMLIRLLSDTQRLAERLTRLRALMPTTNVSKLVSRLPSIVLDYEADDLASRLDHLRAAFGERTDVEFLVAREPNLLQCASSRQRIEGLLENVKRLLPVEDPVSFVISNPGLVLDMESSNLPSAIDGDLTQEE